MMGKLNEVKTTKNLEDSDYINVILADGTLGKIKKIDLFPVATTLVAGLMSTQDRCCYPSSGNIFRLIKQFPIQSHKSLRLKIKARYLNLRISLYGFYSYGFAIGTIIKKFNAYFNSDGTSVTNGEHYVEFASQRTSYVYYIGNPTADSTYIYIDIFNKESGSNNPLLIIESFYPLKENDVEFIINATDLPSNTLNNCNETIYQLRMQQ